jgi:hypothetical protein
MIGWTLICFSFAAKQHELLGYITTRMWLYQIFAFTYSIDYLWFEEAMLRYAHVPLPYADPTR